MTTARADNNTRANKTAGAYENVSDMPGADGNRTVDAHVMDDHGGVAIRPQASQLSVGNKNTGKSQVLQWAGRLLLPVLLPLMALLLLFQVLVYLVDSFTYTYGQRQFAYGFMLLFLCSGLSLIGLRKKLSFVSLGAVRNWLRVHLYLGGLALLLFGMHVSWSLPNGVMDTALFTLFVVAVLSGLFGLWASKTFPAKLRRRGLYVLPESIRLEQSRVVQSLEQLLAQLNKQVPNNTLQRYYDDHLSQLLAKPNGLLHQLLFASRTENRVKRQLYECRRYCLPADRSYDAVTGAEEQKGKEADRDREALSEAARADRIADELTLAQVIRRLDTIEDLVDTWFTLDWKWAHYAVLRGWLFIHVPSAVGVTVLMCVHAYHALVFSGVLQLG